MLVSRVVAGGHFETHDTCQWLPAECTVSTLPGGLGFDSTADMASVGGSDGAKPEETTAPSDSETDETSSSIFYMIEEGVRKRVHARAHKFYSPSRQAGSSGHSQPQTLLSLAPTHHHHHKHTLECPIPECKSRMCLANGPQRLQPTGEAPAAAGTGLVAHTTLSLTALPSASTMPTASCQDVAPPSPGELAEIQVVSNVMLQPTQGVLAPIPACFSESQQDIRSVRSLSLNPLRRN
ncbi:unnamed protein product, partial [Protopolystoma xenopodis]